MRGAKLSLARLPTLEEELALQTPLWGCSPTNIGPIRSGTTRHSAKPVNKADENHTKPKSISTGDTGIPDTAAKLINRVLDNVLCV